MAKVKILDVREMPATEPARVGKMNAAIVYQFDAFRTYYLVLPAEDLTEEKIIEGIRKKEAERAPWMGKELEI